VTAEGERFIDRHQNVRKLALFAHIRIFHTTNSFDNGAVFSGYSFWRSGWRAWVRGGDAAVVSGGHRVGVHRAGDVGDDVEGG
jgi:hypothetical protein